MRNLKSKTRHATNMFWDVTAKTSTINDKELHNRSKYFHTGQIEFFSIIIMIITSLVIEDYILSTCKYLSNIWSS